ncbi:MAG: DapH/DapD/GlmU-related protein, partial [Candidatus Puniceispirillaceae bacterium]
AGSTKIGKNCMFGGQVGVADHVAVGDNVIVAAQSGVTKDLNKPQLYIGYPAQPARDFWRGQARLRKQIKNTER